MIVKKFSPSINELAPYIEQAISDGNNIRLTVTGYSMYPLFRGGIDIVTLSKPVSIGKYDVVLFKRADGSFIFHRVIKVKGDTLTIAGDNETKKEYPVYKRDVIAVMTEFVRDGKRYTLNKIWYILYCRIWLIIFPIRHKALKLVKKLSPLIKKIIG